MSNRDDRLRRMVLLGVILSIPAVAHADFIWPALILEQRILAWWMILTGLFIEFIIVLLMTAGEMATSLWATLAMNAVSTVAGIILIPATGFLLMFPGMGIHKFLGSGRPANIIFAGLSLLVAAWINSRIEHPILRRFTPDMDPKKRFYSLFLANILSVGVAMVSMVIMPVKLH